MLQIVEESEGVAQLSDLERDLALQNLRDVYSALRFGAVEPTKVEVPMEEPIEEVEETATPINTVKPVNNSGTPIEIIRNDIDESKSEQLNLF